MSLATRRKLLPWLFLGPGLLWLLIFFLYPLLNQASVSLMSGNPEQGYTSPGRFTPTGTRSPTTRRSSGARSSTPGIATLLCLIIGVPAGVLHRVPRGPLARA